MHRGSSDAAKVRELMRRLGEEARGPGRVYLVGGASAVIMGWRETIVGVDLKLDPDPRACSRPSPGRRTSWTSVWS